MSTFTRLSRDKTYKRPKTTYQDTLSKAEINDKLEDYVKVDDISKVPVKTHLRYFAIDKETKQKHFRLGGFLMNKDNCDKYVVLGNGANSWSVQVKDTEFFKKKNLDDVKNECQTKINELETVIDKSNSGLSIIELEKQVEKLSIKLMKYKDDNKTLRKLLADIKSHQIDKLEKKNKK